MAGAKKQPALGVSADGLTWTGHVYESMFGAYIGVQTMRCHAPSECEGRGACVIHRPSPHRMRDWRLAFRSDVYLMERTCEHGVGHPDPDDLTYQMTQGNEAAKFHGCDGCCRSGS